MTPSTPSCPNCGAANASDARFCSQCGVTLVTRVGVEERRVVTALFADLVGSTALGEQTDPEVMRALVGSFFEIASREVRRHGGSVERFSGDAVLALFGVGTAHEDDPERAVRAALAIRSALGALREEAATRHAVAVDGRFGIEAGEVVVGDPFGGGTMATGDPVNLAARLEQRAEPGEILIGPRVREATQAAIAVEPLGEVRLKGKADPVGVWRVGTAIAAIGEGRGIPGLVAPLTGRDEELALLLDTARRAKADNKAILFTILGAPGVGKSRLVREATAQLTVERPTTVLRGRCLPYGDGITYWPLAEMVRSWAQIGPELDAAEALARISAVAPDEAVAERLAFAIGLRAEPPAGEGVDEEIAWAFRRLCESLQPGGDLLLFVFEDIHWAEPALLDLIEYLVTWVRGIPAVLLCLARPELLDLRPTWGSGRLEAQRIHLEPLDTAEASDLLGALLDVDELPIQLHDRVLERAEGNPLYVEEVVRMLIDRGVVVRRGDRWAALQGAAEVPVPETIEALIRARLDTLPRPERAVLQTASVVGRVFQRSAIAALAREEPSLSARLSEAVLRDLISEEWGTAPEPTYRFKHILIRDAAYASLPKARRAELHLRVVEWLDGWAGDRRDEFVEIAAYHLEQAALLQLELHGQADASIAERAAEALSRSARRALDREELAAGERFASRALALNPGDPTARAEADALLAEAVFHQSDFPRMVDLGSRLAAEGAALGRLDLQGRGVVIEAAGVWMGPDPRGVEAARELLDAARGLLTTAGDDTWLFEAMHLGGYIGWWYGDLGAARAEWVAASEVAERAGDPGRQAKALFGLSQARWLEGEPGSFEALEHARRLASGSRRQRLRGEATFAGYLCSDVSVERGLATYAAALPAIEELGDNDMLEIAWFTIGTWRLASGDLDGAEEAAERAVALSTAMGHSGRICEDERLLALCRLARGDVPGAETHAVRGVETVQSDDATSVASTHAALGLVREAQGQLDEAEELLRGAVERIEGTDYRGIYYDVQLPLACFYFRRGRTADGEAWLARALESARLHGAKSPTVELVERQAAEARAGAAGASV